MSATILFEPVDPEPGSIPCPASSWFKEAMERAGMGLPCEVGPENIPVLTGLYAASPNGGFVEVIAAINQHGRIRLWAVY